MNRRDFLGSSIGSMGTACTLSGCVRADEQARPPSTERLQGAASIRETMVVVAGGHIYCRYAGADGPPVLLAHPVTGSAHVFDELIEQLATRGYRGIAWSRRGHRGSTIERAYDPPTLEDIDAVADRFGLDRFFMLGSAAGGGLALEYAVARQDRIRGLIVACSVTHIDDPLLANLKRGFIPPSFDELPAAFRELGPEYRATQPEGVQRWLALEKISRDTRTPLRGPPAPGVSTAGLASLRIPALWIAGGADLFSPPAMLRHVQQQVAGSQFASIELAGHSAYWEYPFEFNNLTCEFMDRI